MNPQLLEILLHWAYGDDDSTGNSSLDARDIHFYFVPLESADTSFWIVARLFGDLQLGTIVYPTSFHSDIFTKVTKSSVRSQKQLRDTLEDRYFHGGASEIRELILRDADLTHELIEGKDCGPAVRLLLGAWSSGDIDLPLSQFLSIISKLLGKKTDDLPVAKLEGLYERIHSHQKRAHKRHTSRLSDYANGRAIVLIEDKLHKEGWDIVMPLIFGARPPTKGKKGFTASDLDELGIGEGSNSPFTIESDQAPGRFRLIHCRTAREAQHLLKTEYLQKVDLVVLDLYSSEVPPTSHSKGAHPVTISQNIWELICALRERSSDPTKRFTEPGIMAFTAEENPMAVHTLSVELGLTHFFFKLPSVAIHKSAYYASFRNAVVGALTQSICRNLLLPTERHQNNFTEWLLQFREEHRPLILRLLRHYKYFTAKDILVILSEWVEEFVDSKLKHDVSSVWISCVGRPNKSGPATLSLVGKSPWLREKAGSIELLSPAALEERIRWYESCQFPDGKPRLRENKNWTSQKDKGICVLLLDDVIGTGGQIMDYLQKLFAPYGLKHPGDDITRTNTLLESLNRDNVEFHVVYALGVGSNQPRFVPVIDGNAKHGAPLHVAHRPTSLEDLEFRENVVDVLKEYSLIVKTRPMEFPCEFEPLGWKGEPGQRNGTGNGGLFSTYANTPANTIPVIWGDEDGWKPLFPRIPNPLANARNIEKALSAMECDARNTCVLAEMKLCKSRQELEKLLERGIERDAE